jgi:predicted ribosomally synthesized peptide with SipW-like signal peptide
MKSIFLSVVIISALVISALGGTFATWSDSEVSMDNTITTGSVDLKVNDRDDKPYGRGVQKIVDIDCMIPEKCYGPFPVELWNAGVCNTSSKAYMHIKDLVCENAKPKKGSGYRDHYIKPDATLDPDPYDWIYGDKKPEPELVAEYGGKVNCTEVPGVGTIGDNCCMSTHVTVAVTDSDQMGQGKVYVIADDILKYECQKIYLFDLEPCQPEMIYFWFKLDQPSEEDYMLDLIPDEGEPGYDKLHNQMFNDWPSWALMRDMLTFNIEFDLWLDTSGVQEPIMPD